MISARLQFSENLIHLLTMHPNRKGSTSW